MLVVAPLAIGKAVLYLDIVPVKLAVQTEMCRDKKMELSNHLIPKFTGRIGNDPKKYKSGATIQLLGKDENTGWGLYPALTPGASVEEDMVTNTR